jgi:hypothetical protein
MKIWGQKKFLAVFVVLLACTTVAWWQRPTLLGWYYFHQLSQATEKDREIWVNQLIALDVQAQSQALRCLMNPDPQGCQIGEMILTGLVNRWPIQDGRSQDLLEQLLRQYPSFKEPGKDSALRVACRLLEKEETCPEAIQKLANKLLNLASQDKIGSSLLRLASVLPPHSRPIEQYRLLALAGLHSTEAEQRTLAAHLFLQAPLNQETTLQAEVVTLLKDPSSKVRRAALLVVGSKRELVSEDDLLPLLHDPDPEMSRLCEVALRSRGLKEDHLQLARLISDEKPAARLEVLRYLDQTRDLEPGVWLKRLCQDSSPAVRAAAVRASAHQANPDLWAHLLEMTHTDPSPTVRQLAHFYLRRTMQK